MTFIQPYPVYDDGRPTGLLVSTLSPLPVQAALAEWCQKNVGDGYRLEKRGSYYHSTLYEVWRQGTDVRYKLVAESR